MKVLIVRTGAMGDILHALPAVTAFRESTAVSELGWVVEPRWSPLLGPSLVDRVHFAETRQWGRKPFSLATLNSILGLRRELRTRQYDVAIDLQGSIRSAILAKMSGARRIVGMSEPREKQARWFYTDQVAVSSAHVIEQACEVMSVAAGHGLSPEPVTLPVDEAAEGWAAERVGPRTIFLAPSAGWGAKQWPAARYGEVARVLAGEGYPVLVNAVSNEDVLAREVVEASGGVARMVVASIAQLVALTRRVEMVIAGDTGPLHLAAALEKPMVAIFGPTDPARNGPYGARSVVLRDAASVKDHRRHSAPEAGLLRISVDDVLGAARELLA